MRVLSVATILVAFIAPAAAQMPTYEVERWCEAVSRTTGAPSHVLYGACIRQEQLSYDGMKARWDALEPRIRQWCDRVARTGGGFGSYQLLAACIAQEESAASTNQRTPFRR